MTEMPTSPKSAAESPIFARMASRRESIGTVLMGTGAVVLVTLVILRFVSGNYAGVVSAWAICVAAGIILSGLSFFFMKASPDLPVSDVMRLNCMMLAGFVGLAAVCLGLLLPFINPLYTTITGGLEEWRKNPWVLVAIAVPLLGGLALIMFGLQLGRTLDAPTRPCGGSFTGTTRSSAACCSSPFSCCST